MSKEQAQIMHLDYPENVRKRKEMYIEDPNQMISEIVDNSVDEFSAGNCTAIAVAIVGKTITVQDNGSGIPITIPKDESTRNKYPGLCQAEIAYTSLHSGGKFGGEGQYKTSTGGLHGVGAACVNALAKSTILTIKTGGKKYQINFERGKIIEGVRVIEEGLDLEDTGTTATFELDEEMWGDAWINFKKLNKRLQQLSYLNPGLTIYYYLDTVDSEGKEIKLEETYYQENGILDYVNKLISKKKALTKITGTTSVVDDVEVSIALAYTDSYSEEIYQFCNNISTEEGGDHLTGFKSGVSKAINDYMEREKISLKIESDDTREGLVSIISVKVKEPRFKGQSKSKLDMPNVRNAVKKVTEEWLIEFMDKNPDQSKIIISKIEEAAKAREAAKKARENSRKTKSLIESGLPEGLADCSDDNPENIEIFFVEGDSAGGSAKQGRDKVTQAILPVFGKIRNVEKSRLSQVLGDLKIKIILRALGCGIGEEFDIKKLRYHKIIILADADIDGKHINTLYFTFFYRYLRPIVEAGYLYVGMPPLYKVTKGKQITYLYSKEELDAFDTTGATIQRYKGLGEMNPEQLWETTLNPETRTLQQVTIEDLEALEDIISICMSEDVAPRKQFIIENALNAELDI